MCVAHSTLCHVLKPVVSFCKSFETRWWNFFYQRSTKDFHSFKDKAFRTAQSTGTHSAALY